MTTRRLFLGIFFLALLALTARSATDPDFGWHLRTGEYIVSTQSIPYTDFFSFTAAGEPWITHEWLTQVIIYALYSAGGTFALVLFFSLAATVTFWLVYLRSEGKPYLAAFVVLFAAVAAAPIWGIRPQTISLLLTSTFLYLLDHYRRSGNWKILVWLLPLMVIWANAHGSFALGPFLILIYLVGAWLARLLQWSDEQEKLFPLRPLLYILLGSIAVIIFNPNGIELYPYPFQTLNSRVIQTFIQEWQPPDFHDPAIQPFALMLVATLGALALSRKRVNLTDTILLVGFTFAALRAARQISIWVLVAAPILSAALLQVIDLLPWKPNVRLNEHPSRVVQVLNTIILLVIALVILVRITGTALDQPQAESKLYPTAAVAWLQQEQPEGPLFNLYDWGGYLIWKLYPQQRVFIDGRSDLYGLTQDDLVSEYLEAINGLPRWSETLDKYTVRLVLIPPDSPLAAHLAAAPDWDTVFADESAILFARK